jgi:hypothetical protein
MPSTAKRVREVVDLNLLRAPLGLPLTAPVLEVTDQFLLLGVHGDDRPPGGDVSAAGLADVPELGVAVGALLSLARLGVGLEAVAEVMEQLSGDPMADGESFPSQGLGQLASALAGPPQGRHRVAACLGGDQLLQGGKDRRVRDARSPAHAADAAIAEGAGLGGGDEPPLPLIEVGQDRGKLALQFGVVVYEVIMCDNEKL